MKSFVENWWVLSPLLLTAIVTGAGSVWQGNSNSCPRLCPKDNEPVCGSDGVIYVNECDLQRRNCNKGVSVVDDRKCRRSRGALCQNRCNQDRDLTCGSDSRTYLNPCILKVESCRRGIEVAHMGPCLNSSALEEPCPVDCGDAPRDGPICGSNGNVYSSTCEMKLLTCGEGVVRTTEKHCQTTSHCKEICWKASKAVCGSDGRIYSSSCQMRVKNCGRHVFEMPITNCIPKERAIAKCPTNCDEVAADAVCASDGNIYANLCELQMLNCGPNSDKVLRVDWLRCAAKAMRCSQLNCSTTTPTTSADADYVCGSDGRTYNSTCHLQLASCTRGTELAHVGKCLPPTSNSSSSSKCPESCPPEATSPLCGSDGNVYRSMCEMKRRTCGQHVMAVGLHHCAATKSCNITCRKHKIRSVCGSDGKIYRNTCELQAKNCGKYIYQVPIARCLARSGFNFAGCNRICHMEFDPVCGTDAKTYSNDCFLQLESCQSRSKVTKKHHGRCGEPTVESRAYLYK